MEALIRSISSHSLNTTVNLEDILLSLVYDVVGKVAFGNSYRGKTFNGRTLKDIVEEARECYSDFDGFLQMVLDDHHDTKTSGHVNDFVDDCMSRLTTEEMKALVMNVLEGAVDTSTITMVWAMSELVKNPRVMQSCKTKFEDVLEENRK
ncbi:unnamed protein product [Lactuca virosa]|uniref:Uncharacterized protein n=1 Tax=Lactuca virosa TaxID=75947 RepID=A0AAU9NKE9_9ASTR|nr:unnamed protein product [Lactuca virosa]